jgi:hypothetical protein
MANEIEDRRKLAVDAVMFVTTSGAKDSEKAQVLASLQKVSPRLVEDISASKNNKEVVVDLLNKISRGIYDQDLVNVPVAKGSVQKDAATEHERNQLIGMINNVAADKTPPMGGAWRGSQHEQLQQSSDFIYKSLIATANPQEEKSNLVHLVHLGYFDAEAKISSGLLTRAKTPMGEQYVHNANDPANTPPDRFTNTRAIEDWNKKQAEAVEAKLEHQLNEMQVNSLLQERDAGTAGGKSAAERMVQDKNAVIRIRDEHQGWHDKHPNDAHSPRHGNVLVPLDTSAHVHER